jgi:hypothetical protein
VVDVGGTHYFSADDGATCTLDRCEPAIGCTTSPVGLESLAAVFAAGLGDPACPADAVPARLTRLFQRAAAQAASASSASGTKRQRLLRRVARKLGKGETKAGKVSGLDPTCRAGLQADIATARAQASCLAGAPG